MHFRGHRAYHTPVSSKHPLRSPAVPLKQVSTPRQFQPLPQSCTSCSEGSSLRSPTRYLAEDQKLSRKGFCLTIDPGSTGNMAFTSNKMKKEYWQIPKMTRSHTHTQGCSKFQFADISLSGSIWFEMWRRWRASICEYWDQLQHWQGVAASDYLPLCNSLQQPATPIMSTGWQVATTVLFTSIIRQQHPQTSVQRVKWLSTSCCRRSSGGGPMLLPSNSYRS